MGRLSAGFIAAHVGVPRLVIISTAMCSILILSMMGLNRIPTVVVLGTIYGYVSGICQYISPSVVWVDRTEILADVALLSPLIAHLTSDLSELGSVGSRRFIV